VTLTPDRNLKHVVLFGIGYMIELTYSTVALAALTCGIPSVYYRPGVDVIAFGSCEGRT
jgi:hypothetical protein